nr:immunoglobulin light chain junction region [Macaca mulatta]
CMIWHNNSYIV